LSVKLMFIAHLHIEDRGYPHVSIYVKYGQSSVWILGVLLYVAEPMGPI